MLIKLLGLSYIIVFLVAYLCSNRKQKIDEKQVNVVITTKPVSRFSDSELSEAAKMLRDIGYTVKEAKQMIAKAEPKSNTFQELIKNSLSNHELST